MFMSLQKHMNKNYMNIFFNIQQDLKQNCIRLSF